MKAPSKRKAISAVAAAALTAPLLMAASGPAAAQESPEQKAAELAGKLVRDASAEGARKHLEVFQDRKSVV